MPICIQNFRQGDKALEKVRASQRKRFADENIVDEIVSLDEQCRKAVFALDSARTKLSRDSKEIGKMRKNKQPTEKLQIELKELRNQIKADETAYRLKMAERESKIRSIGNFVHEDVPVSNDEEDNEVIKKWENGDLNPEGEAELLHHHQLLYRIGGYEPEKGAEIAGHRGYFLTGPGVILNMALQQLGIKFLQDRNFIPVQPPYMMNREPMEQTCQLSQFDEELYHVSDDLEKTSKYLIATSEQPLSAFHRNEKINPDSLPRKYAGISTCFRKEAGDHGKEAWGIFRVHQFEKIEQFVYCDPKDSWKMHEEMLSISEEFYKSLGLPYRVVSIVSGALNNAAAKKYDLEGFFPALKRYRELVSCSNCTDYQSRALGIRFDNLYKQKLSPEEKEKRKKIKSYVHLLNSTLCATTRTICCILENYQTSNGVNIPKVLQPYCGNKTFFPFVREYYLDKKNQGINKKGGNRCKNAQND